MAGISFLRARSPVTPKMTSAHGSGIRGRRRSCGSRKGVRCEGSGWLSARHPHTLFRARAAASELPHARRPVGEVQPQQGPAAAGQGLPVAGGLGGLELAEGVRPPGHVQVVGDCTRDLQEHADRRTTLVVLAGGVQEPRAPNRM